MRIANMKIGTRLGAGFGLILLLVAAIGVTGVMLVFHPPELRPTCPAALAKIIALMYRTN